MNKYRSFGLKNFRNIEQVHTKLTEDEKMAIEVVGAVLPFKTNNFVVDELINWNDLQSDPLFHLTFPQKDMLSPQHFDQVWDIIKNKGSERELRYVVDNIRKQLNPNPAGQMEKNVPLFQGNELRGIQHKYEDTVLFFPSHGQTCHAYCTYCFRWPQFIGDEQLKFQMKEVSVLVDYLKAHPKVTDVLITGGDPMIMSLDNLKRYIVPLLNEATLPHLKTIRIGTKSLSYWPYKYTTDPEADELLQFFETVTASGRNLAIMAHFNHPVELQPKVVQDAIKRILRTGAQIRTQAPIMNHINNDARVWQALWDEQVRLGCVPYYMFVARDTGARNYFAVPLVDTFRIFNDSYQHISGLARTVRGPCMSATLGKIQIAGITKLYGEQLLTLKFLRARKKEWVGKIFYAKYDEQALWIDDLTPAPGSEQFFYANEYVEG